MSSSDYLTITAEIPDWARGNFEYAAIGATIQLLTSVADDEARPAQALTHQQRLGNILELFAQQNFRSSLAALDGISTGIGFSGWKLFADNSKDGRTQEKQLGPELAFEFIVYRKQADTITTAALQANVEKAISAFLTASGIFPDGFGIHSAHAVETALAD